MATQIARSAFLISLLVAVSAAAQNTRSFVATYGSDANDCTSGHECRSFTKALSVTNYGGEVLALTSGGYGPFTVTQAVSVIATTGVASVTAPNGTAAIAVSGFGGDIILLRGLSVTVSGTSGWGVDATGFGLLSIENCTFKAGGLGVLIRGDVNSRAVITDTVARGASAGGFSFTSRGVLTRCRAEWNTGAGLDVNENGTFDPRVTATDFVSTGNQHGARVLVSTGLRLSSLTLDRAVLTLNTLDGLFCNAVPGSTALVFIGNSVAADNFRYGLNASTAGSVFSLKNNIVGDNDTAPTNGTINPLTGQ